MPESRLPQRNLFRPLVPALLLGLTLVQAYTLAAPEAQREGGGAESAVSADAPPAAARAVTHHLLRSPAGELEYRAVADTLTLLDADGRPSSRIFYVAYSRAGDAARPLTFVFNGGPGAASAYLHLGAIGPRLLVLGDDGSTPPPPAELADNPDTWLAFTDLVFVDPPGTGYSRMLEGGGAKDTDSREERKAAAWGVEEDARVLADFIRLYLTREEGWARPLFLAGESYGGFRAALLAERLYEEAGIASSGVILISPVLDFALIRGGDQVLLRWCALLPSYAAVAAHHGLGADLDLQTGDLRGALRDIEDYALDGLLRDLATGVPREPARALAMMERLAGYTGMPIEELQRHRARVPASRFAKVLLADRRRVISLYDGTLTAIDPDPAVPQTRRDLYLARLSSLLTAGFHVHVRDTLSYASDLTYRVLNAQVSKEWNWDSGIRSSQGYADVRADLRQALSLNPAMRVLVLHGVHDLVTPYFASAISIAQMGLDPQLRSHVRLVLYPGGHMFYGRRASRERLRADAARFFREALGGTAGTEGH